MVKCSMESLTYVTGNYGKYISVKEKFENAGITEVSDRSCYFLDCLTFFDGNEYNQFFGISKGSLSDKPRGHENRKAKSNLWYVFVPNNCTKTLAEMTDDERNNKPDNSISATDEFINWYKFKHQEVYFHKLKHK